MEREEIQKRLDWGQQLGVRTPTGAPEWLGWVLVDKRSVGPINPAVPPPDDPGYARWLEWRREALERPYHVHRVEVLASVHDSDAYPDNEDQRGIRNFYCPTLDDVAATLRELGHELTELLPRTEIDAP